MTPTFLLASLAMISGLSQQPPAPPPPLAEGSSVSAVADRVPPKQDTPVASWVVSIRSLHPATTTDPQHVAFALGVAHAGPYRANVQYQPSDSGRFGMIHAALGLRLLSKGSWKLAVDLEHTQARPVRRLAKGDGWELAGHDRHQVSLGTATILPADAPWLGLVQGVEVGGGRMQVWRLVSATSAERGRLSASPDPILESSASVGMVGLIVSHQLFWKLEGQSRLRLIGAGRSRGGEVPFAHLTAEWDVFRQVFQSARFGRGYLGVTGTHATSPRAATYFQNGVGIAFRLAF